MMKKFYKAAWGLLLAFSLPAQAQWVPGSGDEFGGAALDSNIWSFQMECFGCTGFPTSTENPSFYSVAGGAFTLLNIETSSAYLGQFVNARNNANVKVSTLPAPPATWYIETAVLVNSGFHAANANPFVGLSLMRGANHGIFHVYKHLQAYDGGCSTIIFMENGVTRDDFGIGNAFHHAPDVGLATDVLTFRIEKHADNAITFSFGRNTAPEISDIYTPFDTGSRKRLYETLLNPQDLRIGLLAAGQGATTPGMTGNYLYLRTNLPVSPRNVRRLYGRVALEDMNFPAAHSATISFEFRDAITGALQFTRHTSVGTNRGSGPGRVEGYFSIADLPQGNYLVRVKGSRWLAATFLLNATGTGDITLPAGAIPMLRGGDANEDNSVDVLDLDLLIQAFDAEPNAPNWNEDADFNGDGSVDVLDLDILIRNFDQSGEV